MAIGAAQMFGFRIINNFRRPYYSKSISEFWRRWHISLSEWLRDYVFLPTAYALARRGKSGKLFMMKTENASYYFATFITMFLIGLWHGANWNFVIWGLLFAFFMIFSRVTIKQRKKFVKLIKINKFPTLLKLFRVGFTFSLVCFCWIFFRAKSIDDAIYIISNSFSELNLIFQKIYIQNTFTVMRFDSIALIICISLISLLEVIHLIQRKGSIIELLSNRPVYMRWVVYIVFIMITIFFSYTSEQKFIYFNF